MNLSNQTHTRKRKRNPPKTVAYTLLLSGTIALLTSIVFSSSILAFTGLGLTFWGALLLYVKPTEYVKVNIFNSTTLSLLKSIDQIITNLKYKGKAIYLPPRYLKDPKSGKVFISSKKNVVIPPIDKVAEERGLLKTPKGIFLTPPGLDLANLYENELGKPFTKINLNYLQNNLPRVFVENLEIAEDLEINPENNFIRVKIKGSINKNLCNETRELKNIHDSIGCPICSSIAIALTRTTGKPITIDKTTKLKDGETIEINFRLLEAPD